MKYEKPKILAQSTEQSELCHPMSKPKMKTEDLQIEESILKQLKLLTEERGLDIIIQEGEKLTCYESSESTIMVDVHFEIAEEIDFGALVAEAINSTD